MPASPTLDRVRCNYPLMAALLLLSSALHAANGASPLIYSCVDAVGKRHTSDRPVAECNDRDQRVLNPDGSVRLVLPPTPTSDERTAMEARDRELSALRAERQEVIRRDRSLMARHPDDAAHGKARLSALAAVRQELLASEARQVTLQADRKKLQNEAEFYAGAKMPAKLKGQIDANDVALEAQRSLAQSQQFEADRINKRFDLELERLKKLWAGASPGSLGALGTQASAKPASSAEPR